MANAGGGNAPAVDEPIEAAPDSPTPNAAEIEELGLLQLHLGAVRGHSLVGGQRAPLPVGSTLKGGVFYWQLAPGFLGNYDLTFERQGSAPIRVRIGVHPKSYGPAHQRKNRAK